MKTIDLSCDLGEAATAAEDAVEEALFARVTSANVACGGHTGDRASMERAVERARAYGVALGAHPSYPDRVGFGRARLSIAPAALVESLVEQIAALVSIAGETGMAVRHVKAHGALYNDAHQDAGVAESIAAAVARFSPTPALVCSAGSMLMAIGLRAGLAIVAEGFADRRYRPDGSLVPRRAPDALILDVREAAEQAVALASAGRLDTLCIHSDTPNAVARLEAIRAALVAAGFRFRAASHG